MLNAGEIGLLTNPLKNNAMVSRIGSDTYTLQLRGFPFSCCVGDALILSFFLLICIIIISMHK